MGLIDRARRLRHVARWRIRYWWMDTDAGRRAHAALFVVSVLVLLWQMLRAAVALLLPAAAPSPAEPAAAVAWWVVQLVIAVVAAAVAYVLRPRVQPPAEPVHEPPTVEDGAAVKDFGGTVWLEHEDTGILLYEVVGRDPIYSKGGKK